MRISINSNPQLLNILRAVVRYRAREGGFPEAEAEQVALAVHEAAANVIRHTYRNRRDARLDLEILIFPDRMEFHLEDSGPKVSAEALRPRPSGKLRPGGVGTQLIHRIMDACLVDSDFPRGNRLKMLKRLPRKGS